VCCHLSGKLRKGIRLEVVDVFCHGVLLGLKCSQCLVHGVGDLTDEDSLCKECTKKASAGQDV
jgi:hypothetical protein